ncbi:hypothetical protein CDD83_6869 [Cordyceps sp. RAO-2017]|nr:hypothetical protein CDD83_6869 [Cordyceps sp. RAO-2017]
MASSISRATELPPSASPLWNRYDDRGSGAADGPAGPQRAETRRRSSRAGHKQPDLGVTHPLTASRTDSPGLEVPRSQQGSPGAVRQKATVGHWTAASRDILHAPFAPVVRVRRRGICTHVLDRWDTHGLMASWPPLAPKVAGTHRHCVSVSHTSHRLRTQSVAGCHLYLRYLQIQLLEAARLPDRSRKYQRTPSTPARQPGLSISGPSPGSSRIGAPQAGQNDGSFCRLVASVGVVQQPPIEAAVEFSPPLTPAQGCAQRADMPPLSRHLAFPGATGAVPLNLCSRQRLCPAEPRSHAISVALRVSRCGVGPTDEWSRLAMMPPTSRATWS